MDYPEAAGFALAQDRLLAQGGPMKKPKRGMIGETFTKGALKGKTIDQANMMARQKWSQSSPQLRDGYANSARRGMMSPSELAAEAKRQREEEMMRGRSMMPAAAPAPAKTTPALTKPAPNPVAAPAPAPSGPQNVAITPPSPLQRPTIPAAPTAPAPALSPMAQAELDKRRAAAAATPTGQPVVSNPGQGINRLTGLPFGYQPGDVIQGDSAMQGRAAQSVSRQNIAESQAASRQMAGKPDPNAGDYEAAGRVMKKDAVVGAKYRAPAAPVVKAPQMRPGVSFDPSKGYQADPKAKPTLAKPGDVSLEEYQTARTRMRSAGSTLEQDKKDQALLAKFGRQTSGY
jgi:hypothetical protein